MGAGKRPCSDGLRARRAQPGSDQGDYARDGDAPELTRPPRRRTESLANRRLTEPAGRARITPACGTAAGRRPANPGPPRANRGAVATRDLVSDQRRARCGWGRTEVNDDVTGTGAVPAGGADGRCQSRRVKGRGGWAGGRCGEPEFPVARRTEFGRRGSAAAYACRDTTCAVAVTAHPARTSGAVLGRLSILGRGIQNLSVHRPVWPRAQACPRLPHFLTGTLGTTRRTLLLPRWWSTSLDRRTGDNRTAAAVGSDREPSSDSVAAPHNVVDHVAGEAPSTRKNRIVGGCGRFHSRLLNV